MGFIRFYWMVFREAFRHSLDITQAVLFVVIGFSGLVVSRNPGAKMIVDGLDLGGWKIAALVFGSIVAIRLMLAPYWVWKTAQARIVSEPEKTLDWGFRSEGFHFLVDKKKKAVQTGFILKSTLDVPVRYEVEDILVTIDSKEVESPHFDSMGAVVSKGGQATFYYPWIFGVPVTKGGAEGFASITFKYGMTDKPFARRAKYVFKLFSPGVSGSKFHKLEEAETNI